MKIQIEKDIIYKLFISDNLSVKEISQKFKISTASVNRLLKLYEIKKPSTLRNKKISNTINNRTAEEKENYSKAVSQGRRGKGQGKTPWNKGLTGKQIAWNKGFHMTDEAKQHLHDIYNNLPDEEKIRRKQIVSQAKRGTTPWNKGLHYKLDAQTIIDAKEKEIATKKVNGTFKTSALEENFYLNLLRYFLPTEIKRQYFNAKKYPFNCDFYIEPLNLYIELNGNWTHGFRPFNINDPECQEQLQLWQQKAETSDYYKNAIYTWTDLDVRKRETAEKNNLLFIQLYTDEAINEFFKTLEE